MPDTAAGNPSKENPFRRAADRVFGGIHMSWVKVILLAVFAAGLTSVFLILPVFDNTSFREMGVYFEAWVLFGVFLMTNGKTPLDAALKTFVFFLISQPLIYLIQVPFSSLGWGLFGYYRYWFIATLLTFPAAYIGWYLKKGSWLSLLILTPVNLLLACLGVGFLKDRLIPDFPNHLISVLFCFGQIALYLLVFFRGWQKRLTGAAAPILLCAILLLCGPALDTGVIMPVPGDPAPALSAQATVRMEDESYGEASLRITPDGARINVRMKKYGRVKLIITDGEKEYVYYAETVTENGHTHVDIIPEE